MENLIPVRDLIYEALYPHVITSEIKGDSVINSQLAEFDALLQECCEDKQRDLISTLVRDTALDLLDDLGTWTMSLAKYNSDVDRLIDRFKNCMRMVLEDVKENGATLDAFKSFLRMYVDVKVQYHLQIQP